MTSCCSSPPPPPIRVHFSVLEAARSSPASGRLADEERPEEAALLVHVHGRGVGHRDEQPVAGAEREQTALVGGVQGEL